MGADTRVLDILESLIDDDPCSWDHNHSCQTHGYFYVDQGGLCPQEDAKRYVRAARRELNA